MQPLDQDKAPSISFFLLTHWRTKYPSHLASGISLKQLSEKQLLQSLPLTTSAAHRSHVQKQGLLQYSHPQLMPQGCGAKAWHLCTWWYNPCCMQQLLCPWQPSPKPHHGHIQAPPATVYCKPTNHCLLCQTHQGGSACNLSCVAPSVLFLFCNAIWDPGVPWYF